MAAISETCSRERNSDSDSRGSLYKNGLIANSRLLAKLKDSIRVQMNPFSDV